METPSFRIFVQARMSSARYPGKMLADLLGRPLISHVVNRLNTAGLGEHVVVLTSLEASDDPLADYVRQQCGKPVFRGDLNDVSKRFSEALVAFPTDWVVRVNGDSPLIDGTLIRLLLQQDRTGLDVVSNVIRRTFPPGQSVECIRASALSELQKLALSDYDREHVTPYFYRNSSTYRLKSIVSTQEFSAAVRLVIDTPEDLSRVASLIRTSPQDQFTYSTSAEVEN